MPATHGLAAVLLNVALALLICAVAVWPAYLRRLADRVFGQRPVDPHQDDIADGAGVAGASVHAANDAAVNFIRHPE